MKIGDNFSLYEFEESQVATRYGYDNSIPKKYIPNVRKLVKSILQPLRDELESPLHISSGYRSAKVNVKVKGSKNSAHLKALAADIWTPKLSPRELTQLIVDLDLPYDTVIHEFGKWTHVACSEAKKKPRKRILTAHKIGNNVTRYANGNLEVDENRRLA